MKSQFHELDTGQGIVGVGVGVDGVGVGVGEGLDGVL